MFPTQVSMAQAVGKTLASFIPLGSEGVLKFTDGTFVLLAIDDGQLVARLATLKKHGPLLVSNGIISQAQLTSLLQARDNVVAQQIADREYQTYLRLKAKYK